MEYYGPIDLSCVHSDTTLDHSKNGDARGLPVDIISFGEMILMKFIRGSEDASDECLGIGLPTDESERRLYRELGGAIYAAANIHYDDATAHAKARLCGWATDSWMKSHHRH